MAEGYDIDTAHFDAARWHRVAEDCNKRQLFPNESSFVEDMLSRTLRGLRPSPAQGRWLIKIMHRK
jgi:hypothetical protein